MSAVGDVIETIPINSRGQIGIHGTYTLGDQTLSAWWLGAPGELQLLVHNRQALPSISPDVTVTSIPQGIALNALGQAVFEVGLSTSGGVRSGAILAYDPIAGLIPIAHTGDLFEVAPGDFRTISDVLVRTWDSTGGQDGMLRPINDLGQIAFTLTFTDNTQGVFIATIPEPASAALLLLGAVAFLRRRVT